jgi:hypothetical protein
LQSKFFVNSIACGKHTAALKAVIGQSAQVQRNLHLGVEQIATLQIGHNLQIPKCAVHRIAGAAHDNVGERIPVRAIESIAERSTVASHEREVAPCTEISLASLQKDQTSAARLQMRAVGKGLARHQLVDQRGLGQCSLRVSITSQSVVRGLSASK